MVGAEHLEIVAWLEHRRHACDMTVSSLPLDRSQTWLMSAESIHRRDGAFFRVIGLGAEGPSTRSDFCQPIIDQPEIGILGFLMRRRDGSVDFLVNAKPEPGNVNLVQLAPTVQATESNYLRRHGGHETRHLEHFLEPSASIIHSDSLQSEQGSRFLRKRNRNMVVEILDDTDLESEELQWFPIESLLACLGDDFAVNTDARSVLVTVPWRELHVDHEPFSRWRNSGKWAEHLYFSHGATTDARLTTGVLSTLDRLDALRRTYGFTTSHRPLTDLSGWITHPLGLRHRQPDGLSVSHYAISTSQREVPQWDQPLMSAGPTHCSLVTQMHQGVLHVGFVARLEVGCSRGLELGPTIQFPDAHGSFCPALDSLDRDLKCLVENGQQVLRTRQSDEGGRFFQALVDYDIIHLPDDLEIPQHPCLFWLDLGQVDELSSREGIFSNESRSALSLIVSLL